MRDALGAGRCCLRGLCWRVSVGELCHLKEGNVKLDGFYGGVQHDVTRDDAPECTEHSKMKAKVCAGYSDL